MPTESSRDTDAPGRTGPAPLTVTLGSQVFVVQLGQLFTFGRSPTCDIHLWTRPPASRPDWEDESISRLAGYFEVAHGTWRVVSRDMDLLVVDDMRNSWKVLRGRWFSVNQPRLTVEVVGEAITHRLHVSYPEECLATPAAPAASVLGSKTKRPIVPPRISDGQKLALLAVFEPVLRHPHPHRAPATYAEAGARLRPPLERAALISRIDAVRRKLIAAGVAGLSRNTGLDEESAKMAMYDYLRSAGVISPEDLDLLP
jgi:hypothetical protein